MATRHIGLIVTGCLIGGLVGALALVVGPVAGAQEHVITGTVLLTFAASWALLATLSLLRTEQPQRWAFALASFMALAGAALLVFAPSGVVIDALGWVWPPLFLALVVGTALRVHRRLHSRTRYSVVYPLLGVYALCAVGGGYQTIREALDRRTYVAPGQLVDVGGHRLHLHCVGSGSLRDEFAELPTSLAQARSFQNVGDRPLVVVTATGDAQAGWLPLQDRMARLSTNSSHRLMPYTHGALVTATAAIRSRHATTNTRRAAQSSTTSGSSSLSSSSAAFWPCVVAGGQGARHIIDQLRPSGHLA